jgi:hypothetical protein
MKNIKICSLDKMQSFFLKLLAHTSNHCAWQNKRLVAACDESSSLKCHMHSMTV